MNGELIRRAKAHGMSASYLNWRGESVDVDPEALAAILDALGDPPEPAAPAAPATLAGAHLVPAGKPRVPRTRCWGITVQLYSVRSRRSWGHGDLHDLADLA